MLSQTIENKELFQKCLDFHGHLCPGLSLGFQAAMAGMDWLAATRSEDEEVVAIVETDACGTDAIQVITGCTFGKGNFIYRDYGKTAFTFFSRQSGKGVRISRKYEPQALLSNRHKALMERMKSKDVTKAERSEFNALHEAKAIEIMEQAPTALLTVTEVSIPLPPKAKIEPSVQCDRCKEPTMASKLESVDGQSLCRGCLGPES